MNTGRWDNQEEAYRFAMARNAAMLDMDMGTGKTRVAIDVAQDRPDVHKVLIVCPKAVIPVWRVNLEKFGNWSRLQNRDYLCWDVQTGTIKSKSEQLARWMDEHRFTSKLYVVVNYDIVWRYPLGDVLLKAGFDLVVLDESHRAKSAGSKVSKFLAMLGKRVKYRMCLSGTPMANSPLDVYGQYRFLDPTVFGTNYSRFLQEYALMGGPEMRFVVGFKNQQRLKDKFNSLAYSCKMEDVAARIKLPERLPPMCTPVFLPEKDRRLMKTLSKEFVAECTGGNIVVDSVLTKMLRLQQIAAGFCMVNEDVLGSPVEKQMNTAKADVLVDLLQDIPPSSSVVVFCVFRHDLDTVAECGARAKRNTFELSGRTNSLEDWKQCPGAVLAVQIQAGAEGVDMTKADQAVYFSLPHSMALYNQSMARLYRPGQTKPVCFNHLIASGTIDEAMYNSLLRKKDIVSSIKDGSFDFGYLK